ncbi:MAG: hypothetical protein ACRDOA_06055 [Streptosporangiaceae bacterium]
MTDWSGEGDLAGGLGEAAARGLAEIVEASGRRYRLDRWMTNGRSRAKVAVVFEDDSRTRSSRRLVLKVTTPADSAGQLAEARRHWQAYETAPAAFAAVHLARPVHEPRRLNDGSLMTFAEIAGDDIEGVEVLTVVLNRMLDGQPTPGCDPGTFARACGAVVGGILHEWTGRPRIAPEWFTVERFLRAHVHDQMAPGGRLHDLSMRYASDEIKTVGEPGTLPNPFALAHGAYFGNTPMIPALIGPSHGDLHSDNLLVRVRPTVDGSNYHLVDLACYEPDGPVTRDPVHLVLYILARRMDVLSAAQQTVLIDVLLAPEQADGRLLPAWLTDLIREIDNASLAWLRRSGLQPEYRRQRMLSLAGCAMLYLGRTSTRREDLDWFLRLAARSATAFMASTAAMPMCAGMP